MPRDLPAPRELCYRISFAPRPLDFPPWIYVGSGRFDDPSLTPAYRVLYTGSRRACFYESLANFRAGRLKIVAEQTIGRDWFDRRLLGALNIDESDGPQKWLDLTSPATFDSFDDEFAGLLLARGIARFDVSTATSADRALSQAIGQWAVKNGYNGIEYMSRHGGGLTCWAIFEGTPFSPHDIGSAIDPADPDLREVIRAWDLRLD